ncbi:DRD2 [Lepeophtheirus salmonis]|uniref:DRD2 n=1 Tax=Lepeophtheirus salmonis TaxID=72036 RepID=A0A7R8CEC0_LEPSM|nr:DRD2 [Lepeophtheirus salmonis]CAF2794592.1 DRD2 [Lepeophtheirus salmonis]
MDSIYLPTIHSIISDSSSSFSPLPSLSDEEPEDEETIPNYWALLLLLLCVVVVVFGNVLVILSVAREKVLQNLTNYFIVSLAVADLLVAGFVMPFSVYVLVNWGMWGLPKIACDFYIALDVICSTSSIFNLVAISIDRYYAVTAPIKYSQHRDKHMRSYVIILLCWMASIMIGSPVMLGANNIPDTNIITEVINGTNDVSTTLQEKEFVCAFYNPEFIIYSSLGSFYIPCIVMIFLYVRIFKALHNRALISQNAKSQDLSKDNDSCKDINDETNFQHDSIESDPPSSPVPTKPNMHHKACGTDGGIVLTKLTKTNTSMDKSMTSSNGFDFLPKKNRNPTPIELVEYKKKWSTPGYQSSLFSSDVKQTSDDKTLENKGLNCLDDLSDPEPGISKTAKFKKVLTMNQIHRGSRKQRKRKKEKTYAKKERKATKTLAVVLVCFLVCWIPFFTCNIVNAVCIKYQIDSGPGDTAFILTTWLGYINSCINPLIYTIFQSGI